MTRAALLVLLLGMAGCALSYGSDGRFDSTIGVTSLKLDTAFGKLDVGATSPYIEECDECPKVPTPVVVLNEAGTDGE